MRLRMLRRCYRCEMSLSTRSRFKAHCVKYANRFFSTQNSDVLTLSKEIESAVHEGRPMVAMETTILTHGMPYPDNLRTAIEVEDIVRSGGAVPATIGILNGNIHVGLNRQQLEFLADPNTSTVKTSRRDLPLVVSQGLHGGTTVSGTMIAAHMAGISVFVTGGIGGVHRGAESSMDISADLTELSRTPVTVISAGVKSILDIGRTLEYLETEGVTVSTFGSTREFPSFFTRRSGHTAPYHLETAVQAAEMLYAKECLGLQSGSLIAVPIPEQFDILGEEIETVIQSIVKEAVQENIQGKEITPYILQRVNELTKGKSLKANIHLIKNNAEVGTRIAVELSSVRARGTGKPHITNQSRSNSHITCRREKRRPLDESKIVFCSGSSSGWLLRCLGSNSKLQTVVGGSILDFTARMSMPDFKMNGATYPGSVQQSFGGVGRNIADGLSRLDVDTLFISAVGNDSHRTAFEAHCNHMNLDAVAILDGRNTATYCAVLKENGELMFGIGDMDIHQQITPEYISQFEGKLKMSSLVCIDGNISLEAMEYVCLLCRQNEIPVFFDPADMYKAAKPFQNCDGQYITYASPNFNELKMMASHLAGKDIPITGAVDDMDIDTVLHECTKYLKTVSGFVPVTLVTIGKHGVVLCHHGDRLQKLPMKGDHVQRSGGVVMEHYPASVGNTPSSEIVSVSGAGDCMVAAFIAHLLQGKASSYCVRAGLLAGQISLRSSQAVPASLTVQAVSDDVIQRQMNVIPLEIHV